MSEEVKQKVADEGLPKWAEAWLKDIGNAVNSANRIVKDIDEITMTSSYTQQIAAQHSAHLILCSTLVQAIQTFAVIRQTAAAERIAAALEVLAGEASKAGPKGG